MPRCEWTGGGGRKKRSTMQLTKQMGALRLAGLRQDLWWSGPGWSAARGRVEGVDLKPAMGALIAGRLDTKGAAGAQ